MKLYKFIFLIKQSTDSTSKRVRMDPMRQFQVYKPEFSKNFTKFHMNFIVKLRSGFKNC